MKQASPSMWTTIVHIHYISVSAPGPFRNMECICHLLLNVFAEAQGLSPVQAMCASRGTKPKHGEQKYCFLFLNR
jgi:hypothetical protein